MTSPFILPPPKVARWLGWAVRATMVVASLGISLIFGVGAGAFFKAFWICFLFGWDALP